MDTYKRNYWSLYLDFIDSFKGLTYKGISLPYLFHFRSLIRKNKELLNALHDESFGKYLNNLTESTEEVQSKFDSFINLHKSEKLVNRKDGKVVLHDVANLLRFPEQTIIQHFDPSNTIMLRDRKMITTNSKEKNESLGLPTYYLNQYLENSGEQAGIVKNTQSAIKIINTYNKHPLFSDKGFQQVLCNQIEKTIKLINGSRKFLNSVPTSCILFASTHYPESRTLALVAAEMGIPTICMQHGIISSEFGYFPKIATVNAVYGKFEVDWYRQMGVKDQSVEVIGHPRFDLIFKSPSLSKNQFQKNIGLDPKKNTILMIVRGEKDIDRWREFIQALLRKTDVNIIVKDYPSTKPYKLTKEYSSVFPTMNVELYDIIQNVDAVVTYHSTVGLEAMLADRPVFVLNNEFSAPSGYFNSLGKLIQEDPVKLAKQVINYLNGKLVNYEQRIRMNFLSYNYSQDTTSGERIKRLVNRLTNNE
ncbi:CDP-glycerol glycerophosphotransferase family protein [Fredinandcohnia onubensis]|uniref:CDP-glycerol glycerophosphotransferase family protein n=1 Tax=Fredinandcohnia onubensis TaxID=1571209 RepID=UPI000C0BF44F|nr:CDP-glycerol glycerophosphotransferase family protein [Fredinandcohnia onubensis]